jgi:hypothetical protein
VSFGQTRITGISDYYRNTEIISIGPDADAIELNIRFKSLATG